MNTQSQTIRAARTVSAASKAKAANTRKANKVKAILSAPTANPGKLDMTEARANLALQSTRAHGAMVIYAACLSKAFGNDWVKIPMAGMVSDNEQVTRLAIKEEQKALYALLASRKHSNPSKVWGDVRRYATRALEGDRASAPANPKTATIAKLGAVYVRLNNKIDEMGIKQKECAAMAQSIARFITRLGGDLSALNEKIKD